MKRSHFFSIYINKSLRLLFGMILLGSIVSTTFAQFAEPPVPIPISANWTLEKNQAGASYGRSVSGAGDVNGDGYEDVIVGAPLFDNGQVDEGAAFLYYGSAAGLSASPGWNAQSNQVGAQFGFSVSTAGDINNDGYDDVIIGAPYFDNVEINEGRVFLYMGSSTGLNTTAIWTSESDEPGALYGYDVASAGNINNDAFDDIIIGAPIYDYFDFGDPNQGGMIFSFYGSATGLSAMADWQHTEGDEETGYGISVSTARDVNSDGYDDVIVGANTWGWEGDGRAFLYYGSATGLGATFAWSDFGSYEAAFFGTSVSTAGDVNADGFSDVIISAPNMAGLAGDGIVYLYYGSETGISINPDWQIGTDQESADYGQSISTAGDMNGDGYSDIIIGVPDYSHGQTEEGVIYIFTGGPDGIPGTTAWVAESNQINGNLGSSVASAGDVNGDGFDDVISGAPFFDNGQTDEGQARVYLGNSGCETPPDVTFVFADDIVCAADGIYTLTDGIPSGGTYTGTGIVGTNQFDPGVSGIGAHTITYTYIAPGGCSATATDVITVSENPIAATTLGSASLNLCVSSPVVLVANTGTDITYQWYKNNVPIPGAIYLAYLAYTTGNYQVQVTNDSGCSKMSSKKKVTHSGCKEGEEINNNELVIYPNPNNGEFNFTFTSENLKAGNILIEIFDITGRLVGESKFNIDGMEIQQSLNLDLPSGIYTMKLTQGNIFTSNKFIIN